jgi:hypothetical protein
MTLDLLGLTIRRMTLNDLRTRWADAQQQRWRIHWNRLGPDPDILIYWRTDP